jgi:adenylate kinase family enzyme
MTARRIILLGCAGSGKTTLARLLGERTGHPVISLDAIWQPHWTNADRPQFRSLIRTAHAGDAWISDGNFAAVTFDLRLPRADLIVWLDRPRPFCAWRALARVLQPGEFHRAADLPKVLRFIRGFDRINRPLIEAGIAEFGAHVPLRRLRTDREIDAFVAGISPHANSRGTGGAP